MKPFLTAILVATSINFTFGQISYDTVYTKIIGNYVYHTIGHSLVETPDDNLLLSTGYYGGLVYCNWRPKLYKANSVGDTTWSQSSILGNGRLISTSDGNYINLGYFESLADCSMDTLRVTKFTINADILWTRNFFFGTCNNHIGDIIETSDGGFAVLSFYSITDCSDPFYNSALIKLDSQGNTEWVQHYGSPTEYYQGRSLVQTSDDHFGISYFKLATTVRSIHLNKTDPLGNILWNTQMHIGSDVAADSDLDLLPNDAFLFASKSMTFDVVARVEPNGVISLREEYATNDVGEINARYLPNHNAYLFTSGAIVNIIDTYGASLWSSAPFFDRIQDVIQLSNNDIVTIGYDQIGTVQNTTLVRFRETSTHGLAEIKGNSNYKIYPNPFNEQTLLKFENPNFEVHDLCVYSSSGQLLFSIDNITSNEVFIERKNLTNGMYIFQLNKDKEVVATGKLLIQ